MSLAVVLCRAIAHGWDGRLGNEAAAFVPRCRQQASRIADKMRAMHDGLPEDVAAALGRLEAGVPTGAGPWQPCSAQEAVKAWVAARGLRPGEHQAPPMSRMNKAFEEHAAAEGWSLESLPSGTLGRCLKQLGFRTKCRGGVWGVLVTRDNARALWGGLTRTKLPSRRTRARVPAPARPGAPLFWESLANGKRRARAMPLVDTLGRVWPSSRVASSLLRRVSYSDIQACATGRRGGTGGCLWRYLTPDELASVPAMHISGHVLPSLAWGGTVAARTEATGCCPTCGRRTDGEG